MSEKKEVSRSQYVVRNTAATLLTQLVKNVLGFVSRTVFIWVLGKELLGINSLFTEILTVLSFAELGIGNAFVYSLYKPLAERDKEKLASLMRLFGKAYKGIGVLIGMLGLCLLPFLKLLVGDVTIEDSLLYTIFLLYVFNTAVSYFFVYKTSLIVADQKNYVVLVAQECFHVVQVAVQVAVLLITGHYVLFMIITVVCTVGTNAFLAHKADKMYPFLVERGVKPLTAEERGEIVKNVKSLVVYKLGSTVLGGTDSIFISAIINVVTVGFYSNYKLLVDLFTSLGSQVVSSVTASVGNVNASESKERKEAVFDGLLCASAWFFGLSSVVLLLLSSDFIRLWVGADYVLDFASVAAIIGAFYVNNMHHACFVYRNTAGLFVYGKYIPIIASALNIVLDIVLGLWIGLPGIFLATIISRMLTYEIVDPLIIYKRVFGKNVLAYYSNYLKFTAIVAVAGVACWAVLRVIPVDSWFGFVGGCIVVGFVYCSVFCLLAFKTSGFDVLYGFARRVVRR